MERIIGKLNPNSYILLFLESYGLLKKPINFVVDQLLNEISKFCLLGYSMSLYKRFDCYCFKAFHLKFLVVKHICYRYDIMCSLNLILIQLFFLSIHVQILEGLLKLPENRECADCKSKQVVGYIKFKYVYFQISRVFNISRSN